MELPTQLGPKMLACSDRERRFVWEFMANGLRDASDAARKAGVPDPGMHSSSIRVRAHELRHRPRVIEAMKEVARAHFGGLLLPAVLAAEDMISNPKHPDHAKAVLSILSANGLGDRTKVDLSISGEVTLNHTDAALDDLRRLLALRVPRETLVEMFGASGLLRYERMLAEAPKVIEHSPNG